MFQVCKQKQRTIPQPEKLRYLRKEKYEKIKENIKFGKKEENPNLTFMDKTLLQICNLFICLDYTPFFAI